MRPIWPVVLAPMLALVLSACSNGPSEADSVAVIDRFHTALNADDIAAIDGMLSKSTRNLRPGIGTARAFLALSARHGRYVHGYLAGFDSNDGRASITWRARYERGPVSELFVLVNEGGQPKIDSYTDNAAY